MSGTTLSELAIVLIPLQTTGLVVNYNVPVDWEGGNAVSTLWPTMEWAQALGLPPDEDAVTFNVVTNPYNPSELLVHLHALHSDWDRTLAPVDVHWEALEVLRDRFHDYNQSFG